MQIKQIKRNYRHLLRLNVNRKNQDRLHNQDFSIISQNCVGGVIYHELGKQFTSPTINMYMDVPDYIRFISNLKDNIYSDFEEIKSDYSYPCAAIGGGSIKLHLVHYQTFQEAKEKWIERSKRINWSNLYFIMCDGDGCRDVDISAFDSLPYLHKAFLTYKKLPDIKCGVTLPETQDGNQVIDLCGYPSKFSGLRYLDRFDYVSFLNER